MYMSSVGNRRKLVCSASVQTILIKCLFNTLLKDGKLFGKSLNLFYKKPCRHVLSGKIQCINQAIHMLLVLDFLLQTHSRPSQKLTPSTVTCIEVNAI